jgi:hypothetical protein
VRPTEDRPPRTPRWVKVSGFIAIVVVLLFVVLHLTGLHGGHGPGQHMSSGDPSSNMEHAGQQP